MLINKYTKYNMMLNCRRGRGSLLVKAQYTPRRVSSRRRRRRRWVHEFATTADGFGDANALTQPSAVTQFTTADGCVNTNDTTKLSPTSCEFVYTPPTRRDSTVSSRRRCVLGFRHSELRMPLRITLGHFTQFWSMAQSMGRPPHTLIKSVT